MQHEHVARGCNGKIFDAILLLSLLALRGRRVAQSRSGGVDMVGSMQAGRRSLRAELGIS